MAKRYRVIHPGYIRYPADKKSLAAIDRAGGLSKMDDRSALNIKTAKHGDMCDGMQPRHIAHYLARGYIVEIKSQRSK